MGFGLLGLSAVAALVLIFTLGLTGLSRINRPWLRMATSIVWLITASAPTINFLTLVSYVLHDANIRPRWLFAYMLSGLAIYLVGSVIVMVKGLKQKDNAAAAVSWPRRNILIGLVVSIVISISTLFIMDRSVMQELEKAMADADAEIQALSSKPVPEKENAAPLYTEVFNSLAPDAMPKWWTSVDDHDFDLSKDEVQKFLDEKKGLIDKLRNASELPLYYVHIDHKAETPWIPNVLNAGKLVGLHACSSAAKGDTKAALDDIELLQSMSHHLSNVTAVIYSLNSAALVNRSVTTLQCIMRNTGPGFSGYPSIETAHLRPAFSQSLRLEKARLFYYIPYIAATGRLQEAISGKQDERAAIFLKPLWMLYRVFIVRHDLEFAKEWYEKAERLYPLPPFRARQENDLQVTPFGNANGGGLITAIALPSSWRYGQRVARTETLVDMYRVAIAAIRFRQKSSGYPENPEQLSPAFLAAVPADPFDGRPLKMRSEDARIVLYSVGENGKDEGGKADDISFVLAKR